jgi:hypothetical protein
MDYQKKDLEKYYIKNPENFSEERNKYIIDSTIREYEETRKKRRAKQEEDLAERIDAATYYLMKLEKSGDTPAERYFGKRELARLRGQKISQSLQQAKRILEPIKLDEVY